MANEHLNDLLRQRAALQAQLDALDRSIAAAVDHPNAPLATPPTHSAIPVVANAQPEYEPDPAAIALKTKRGCLLYFCLFLCLGALVMVLIYFWRYRDRTLLMAPTEQVSRTRHTDSA